MQARLCVEDVSTVVVLQLQAARASDGRDFDGERESCGDETIERRTQGDVLPMIDDSVQADCRLQGHTHADATPNANTIGIITHRTSFFYL